MSPKGRPRQPAAPAQEDPLDHSERSIAFFVYYYFRNLVFDLKLDLRRDGRYCGIHRAMLDDMQDCCERGLKGWDNLSSPIWRFIVAPRGFAKSTCLRFLYLWLLAFPHKLRVPWIINLSRDQKKARKNMEYVKSIIMSSPEYCADFAFGKPDSDFELWNVDAIKSCAGYDANGRYRAPLLIEASGFRGVRGMHAGLIAVDDPEETEDVQNPDTLSKRKEEFSRDVMGSIEIEIPMFLAGTMLSEDAIVTTVARGKNCKKGEVLVGWAGREIDAVKPDGTAAWPQKFPVEKLDMIRAAMNAMHEGSFEYEFMNDPKGFKNNVWPAHWWPPVEPPPEELMLGQFNGREWVSANGVYHLSSVDPATKTTERADYSACITAVIVMDRMAKWFGHAWLVDDWRAKLEPYDLMQRMHAQCDRYPKIIGVEASHGDVFAMLLRKEREHKKVKTIVESLSPWGARKEERARRGNYLVQMKRIHISPWISEEFRNEVYKFPFNRPGHDDFCDCLSQLQQLITEKIVIRNPLTEKKPLTQTQKLLHDTTGGVVQRIVPPVGRSNIPC